MNKPLISFSFLLWAGLAFSGPVFNYLKESPQGSSYVTKVILDHLKTQPINDKKAKSILTNMQKTYSNIQDLELIDQKFFLSSEFFKTTLNFKFKSKSSLDTLSSLQIKSLKTKLENYQVAYSPLAQFIIQSTYLDFKDFLKGNFIDKYQNLKSLGERKYLRVVQLRKSIKYSGKWANTILESNAQEFNNICTELVESFYRNTAIQSRLFLLHSAKSKKGILLLNGLDHLAVKSFLNGEEAKNEKQETDNPLEAIKDINIDPVEQATQEIDDLFKNDEL